MKRILIANLFLLITSLLYAQTANEITQFSQVYNFNATARGMGMGGAVGALHSEYASIGVNPGALATFHMGQIMVSPEIDIRQMSSNFLNKETSISRNSYLIKSAGIVYSFDNRNGDFNRFNISFGYSHDNNFNAYYHIKGQPAANQSFAQEITNMANAGFRPAMQWIAMARPAFINNTGSGYSLDQGIYNRPELYQQITNSGSSGQYALSFGTSYRDKIYIGLTASISDLNFEQRLRYDESAIIGGTETGLTQEISSLTSGTGFNARLGVMYMPLEDLTIGLAAQSPVFYSLSVDNMGSLDILGGGSSYRVSFDENSYDYTLRTPWHFTLSAAYEFGTRATISLDYEVVTNNLISLDGDFQDMSESTVENIRAINELIPDEYKLAMNIRAGGELRFGQFYARAGFAYLGAPTQTVDAVISGAIGGGYRIHETSIDLAYRYASASETFQTFAIAPLTTVDRMMHQILLSLTYRF